MSDTPPNFTTVRDFSDDPQYKLLIETLQTPDMTLDRGLNAVKDTPGSLKWTQARRNELCKRFYDAVRDYVTHRRFLISPSTDVARILREVKEGTGLPYSYSGISKLCNNIAATRAGLHNTSAAAPTPASGPQNETEYNNTPPFQMPQIPQMPLLERDGAALYGQAQPGGVDNMNPPANPGYEDHAQQDEDNNFNPPADYPYTYQTKQGGYENTLMVPSMDSVWDLMSGL